MSELTERESEILKHVQGGTYSPSTLARKLGISESGASQALQKLASKGRVVRRKTGRSVLYETTGQAQGTDLFFLSQAYNSLSQVWAYIMAKDFTREDLEKARRARDTLEDLLARRELEIRKDSSRRN